VKRLYKSRKNKMIDGVCSGIAEYFDIDPVMVRIVFILFAVLGGSGIVAYIVGMIIIPPHPGVNEEENRDKSSHSKEVLEVEPKRRQDSQSISRGATGSLVIGIVLIALGGFFLMGNFEIFRYYHRWIWHNFWDFIIPGIVIAVGLALIIKGKDRK